MNHTKGSWFLKEITGNDIQIRVKRTDPGKEMYDYVLCTLGGWGTTADANRANASLIAASPELYEALKSLVWALEQKDKVVLYANTMNAKVALAKAEGL